MDVASPLAPVEDLDGVIPRRPHDVDERANASAESTAVPNKRSIIDVDADDEDCTLEGKRKKGLEEG